MHLLKRTFWLAIVNLIVGVEATAQQQQYATSDKNSGTQAGLSKSYKRLSIGDKIPASVWKKIPKKKTAKLVILDFWSTGCLYCMESFPKMAKLQKQFDEKLQVVLMNPWETEQQIKERMDRVNVNRIRNGMEPYTMLKTLPSISGDTVYTQLFPFSSVPDHVWLDSAGTVLYITYYYNADPVNIQAVLKGKRLNMTVKDDVIAGRLWEKGYVQPTETQMPPIYYSAFIPYFSVASSASTHIDSNKGTFRRTEFNNSVIDLFSTAFRDSEFKKRDRLVLEMKNRERFQAPDYHTQGYLLDDWYRKYCFTYEIQVPLRDRNNWQQKMQHDVNDFFGNMFGIEGVIETKKFNCLILVKIKDGLLKTSGAEKDSKYGNDFRSWTNQPFKYVLNCLHELEDMSIGRPFLDETGVDPELKVDVQLNGDLKDLENVRKQLARYGLTIIKGIRDVEVLVIRDKK